MKARIIKALRVVIRALIGVVAALGGKMHTCVRRDKRDEDINE